MVDMKEPQRPEDMGRREGSCAEGSRKGRLGKGLRKYQIMDDEMQQRAVWARCSVGYD